MAPTDVITLQDALDHLNMDPAPSSTQQIEIGVHVTAASAAVEHYVGPVIMRTFTDYEVSGRNSLVLTRLPVVELVSVTPCNGNPARDVADYRVVPTAGIVRPRFGGRLHGAPFDVTYRAGHAETVADVPDALGLACRIIVAHLWETQRGASFGPQPGVFGEELATPTGASGFAIPYRARDLMLPYRTVALA